MVAAAVSSFDVTEVAPRIGSAMQIAFTHTMSRKPILASIMSGRRIAPTGGETEFCNTYAAWDELPEDDKKRLEGLKVIHAMWRSQLYWNPEPAYDLLKRWMEGEASFA